MERNKGQRLSLRSEKLLETKVSGLILISVLHTLAILSEYSIICSNDIYFHQVAYKFQTPCGYTTVPARLRDIVISLGEARFIHSAPSLLFFSLDLNPVLNALSYVLSKQIHCVLLMECL